MEEQQSMDRAEPPGISYRIHLKQSPCFCLIFDCWTFDCTDHILIKYLTENVVAKASSEQYHGKHKPKLRKGQNTRCGYRSEIDRPGRRFAGNIDRFTTTFGRSWINLVTKGRSSLLCLREPVYRTHEHNVQIVTSIVGVEIVDTHEQCANSRQGRLCGNSRRRCESKHQREFSFVDSSTFSAFVYIVSFLLFPFDPLRGHRQPTWRSNPVATSATLEDMSSVAGDNMSFRDNATRALNSARAEPKFHWTAERIQRLIVAFRSEPLLWDIRLRTNRYTERYLRSDAWNRISFSLRVSRDECERKMGSLMAQYRREHIRQVRIRPGLATRRRKKWSGFEWFDFITEMHSNNNNSHNQQLQSQRSRDSILEASCCCCLSNVFNVFVCLFVPRPKRTANLAQRSMNWRR